MKLSSRKRLILFLSAILACTGASLSSAATMFTSIDLDLEDTSVAGNNIFTTIIKVPVGGTTLESNPVFVNYEDPAMSGMQVNLDIDFSSPLSPVVNSIEFDGAPGDIEHVFPGGIVDLEFSSPGLLEVDLEAVPNGIKGFLRTQSGPIPVTNGEFLPGNTNLIARQGTIDVDGTVAVLGFPDTVDRTIFLNSRPLDDFDEVISNNVLNTIDVVFDRVESGQIFYDVIVNVELENALLPFEESGFEVILDITGTLKGAGQVSIDVPEPATLGLFATAIVAIAVGRNRNSF